MKSSLLTVLFFLATGVSSVLNAEVYKEPKGDPGRRDGQVVIDLHRSAAQAALAAGADEVGSISCDRSFIHCSCEGAFDCAWLAWACGESGGIQGFDGDCFFPGSVPSAGAALDNFKNRIGKRYLEASCEGVFCDCTGPANSEDCNKITGCLDDFLCIGDKCSCIGGSVDPNPNPNP